MITFRYLGREAVVWGLGLYPILFNKAQKDLVTWNCFLFYSVFLYSFSSMFCVMCSLQVNVETEVLLGKHLFIWKINGFYVAQQLIY